MKKHPSVQWRVLGRPRRTKNNAYRAYPRFTLILESSRVLRELRPIWGTEVISKPSWGHHIGVAEEDHRNPAGNRS
jgi:hypothetical protein